MSTDKEIKQLKASAGQCKATFTRYESYFDQNKDDNSPIGIATLKARFLALEKTLDEYRRIQLKLNILLEKDAEEDFLANDLEDRYYNLYAKVNTLVAVAEDSARTDIVQVHNSKLPYLDIPIFTGEDVTKYKPFIELFHAVIGNEKSLKSVQKLCHLRNHLKKEAEALIDGLPLVDESYEEALSLLKQRYDNMCVLISSHVNTILDYPNIVKGTAANLRGLVSHVRQHLGALKNMDQPTESWDMILLPILLRKLDPYSSRSFSMERVKSTLPKVTDLLVFLESRASSYEESQKQAPPFVPKSNLKPKEPKVFLNNCVNNNNNKPSKDCLFCKKGSHKLYNCPEFKLGSIDDRIKFVKENKICSICLNKHKNAKCQYRLKCASCDSNEHNSLLHHVEEDVHSGNPDPINLHNAMGSGRDTDTVLLPTVKLQLACKDGTYLTVRGILDSGSQTSFVTTDLVNKLKLKSFKKDINITTLGQRERPVSQAVVININNLDRTYSQDVICSIVDKITSPLPQQKVALSYVSIPKGIKLADASFNTPEPISVLLAADIFFNVILTEKIEVPSGLTFLETKFGFIVAGGMRCVTNKTSLTSCVLHAINEQENLSKLMERFWEVESKPLTNNSIDQGCKEQSPGELSQDLPCPEDVCEAVFKGTTVLKEGRFHVNLPLIQSQDSLQLGDSFSIAFQRLNHLLKRFQGDQDLKIQYTNFIDEYVQSGHAKLYDVKNSNLPFERHYFLPHHPVLRPDKRTTKIRVVFDGSAHTNSNVSLNDLLFNGRITQRDLFDILVHFRSFEYIFISDVKAMFRQIVLNEPHKCLQNILWKTIINDDVKCFQLQTVTYGMKSSSYLATRCLKELADQFGAEFPLAANVLANNTYVDDILAGAMSVADAIQVRDQIIHLLTKGGFELHKWAANHPDILTGIPVEKQHFEEKEMSSEHAFIKALGIFYDVKNDNFKVCCVKPFGNVLWTKRSVLSFIGSLFDPLGIIGPIVVKAKLFMQTLWQCELYWDDKLPKHILKDWSKFYTNVCDLQPIQVVRNLKIHNADFVQLIGFCDASQHAFGGCVYVRAQHGNDIIVNLVCAKSRVAPLKQRLTIPKLELSSAVLLSQLASKVSEILKISDVILYTDSMVTLAWIQSKHGKLETFVKNRVNIIKSLTNSNSWLHVSGVDNPADCLSRGVDPKALHSNTMWWHGPLFLKGSDYKVEPVVLPTDLALPCEPNEAVVGCIVSDHQGQLPIFEKVSNIAKLQRIIAYVFRFYLSCRNKVRQNNVRLTVPELHVALEKIIIYVQNNHFHKELHCLKNSDNIQGSLGSLSPFIDGKGVLRVGGRIDNANIPYSQRHPILLPKNCQITSSIIVREHLDLLHAGPKLTLSNLSSRFWIISGIREVKKVLHKCVRCFKLKSVASEQLMGSLPRDRVIPIAPYYVCGIDYCGPFEIKQARIRKPVISKGYVALFVCFITKAIHMELVSDMTSETFLAALKRFISRRGLPSKIYCDNATTFKGCNSNLNSLYKLHHDAKNRDNVINFANQKGIEFHYIPAYSPTFGGLWEAGVKSAKYHFRRVVGKTILTYEEFQTVIVQVEGILNSRPLGPMTRDGQDFNCLTPAHFLVGRPITALPEPDYTLIPTSRLRFWHQCTQIVQSFWKIWKASYINQLQSRPKWRSTVPNIQKGQLVLFREESSPLDWPLAIVVDVFPGKDNRVRVVKIKFPNKSEKTVAVNKVSLLPLYD